MENGGTSRSFFDEEIIGGYVPIFTNLKPAGHGMGMIPQKTFTMISVVRREVTLQFISSTFMRTWCFHAEMKRKWKSTCPLIMTVAWHSYGSHGHWNSWVVPWKMAGFSSQGQTPDTVHNSHSCLGPMVKILMIFPLWYDWYDYCCCYSYCYCDHHYYCCYYYYYYRYTYYPIVILLNIINLSYMFI